MELSAEPSLTAEADQFDSYVLCDALCRPAGTTAAAAPCNLPGVLALLRPNTIANSSTLALSTPPVSAALSGESAGGAAGATLRRLGYHCNRLCALQREEAAYFLAEGGVLHRLAPTAQGGRVDAVPSPLPGWPAPPGALATLVEIRNSPAADDSVPHDPPCLLASDGRGLLWVCDADGDPVTGVSVPLPLPPAAAASEGWCDWLLADASWAPSEASAAGRVECSLLGYKATPAAAAAASGSPAKCWCVLSVGVVLPAAGAVPPPQAAAAAVAHEPLFLRCGPPGAVRCLLNIPPAWGEQAEGGGGGGEDAGQQPAEDAIGGGADGYSAVELRAGKGADQASLQVVARQSLDGWRPLASPTPADLSGGAVLLCSVQRPLSLARGADEPLRIGQHAHVFGWQDGGGGAAELLWHAGLVGALGYVCSARPQRRFVCACHPAPRCTRAGGHRVSGCATGGRAGCSRRAAGSAWSSKAGSPPSSRCRAWAVPLGTLPRPAPRAQPPRVELGAPGAGGGARARRGRQQICKLEEGLGELVGLTILEAGPELAGRRAAATCGMCAQPPPPALPPGALTRTARRLQVRASRRAGPAFLRLLPAAGPQRRRVVAAGDRRRERDAAPRARRAAGATARRRATCAPHRQRMRSSICEATCAHRPNAVGRGAGGVESRVRCGE
jgi:hypothetical protein